MHPGVEHEAGDDRGVVARSDILLHATRPDARGQGVIGKDVVDPPADVSLAHLAPGRPPCVERVVFWVDGAADIDEPVSDDSRQNRAFFWELTDGSCLAFLRMHVAFTRGHVEVATEQDAPLRIQQLAGIRVEGCEESHLCSKVLAAIGHVGRYDGHGANLCGDNAVLEVETGMNELWALRRKIFTDVQADAGVTTFSVPIAPVALHFAEGLWYLI